MGMKGKAYDLKLASGSPRRKELLEISGWRALLEPVAIEESPHSNEDPRSFAKRLALEKVQKSADGDGMIVLGADTVVALGDKILGKPKDGQEAAAMLKELRGRVHQVITAIALLDPNSRQSLVEICETDVPMRNYSEEQIAIYIESGSPLDKAGAYGIQDGYFNPVDLDAMEGCFANVMGLPLCHLVRVLRRLGLETPKKVYARCMEHTKYHCRVYPEILQREI